ncbi:MAG: hypothetical protein GX620_09730 [Chloroflexi bacterium]|nr:hypothetical protein [Chloroflexota bacterium]
MRILHISDFHLPNNPSDGLYGLNPFAQLEAAQGAVASVVPAPDLVIVGGDILNEGNTGDYGVMRALLSQWSQPVHYVLGNHDSLDAYNRTGDPPGAPGFPGYYSFDRSGYHFVLLYTSGTGRGYGEMDGNQLAWLACDLAQAEGRPTLVFAHHPPVDVGVPWLDDIKLRNAAEFWGVLAGLEPQICGVFAAHVHMQATCLYRGVLVATCPSIGWQFVDRGDANEAERSEDLPGFNLIDLPVVPARQVILRTVRYRTPA